MEFDVQSVAELHRSNQDAVKDALGYEHGDPDGKANRIENLAELQTKRQVGSAAWRRYSAYNREQAASGRRINRALAQALQKHGYTHDRIPTADEPTSP